jgi:hypothetical protein
MVACLRNSRWFVALLRRADPLLVGCWVVAAAAATENDAMAMWFKRLFDLEEALCGGIVWFADAPLAVVAKIVSSPDSAAPAMPAAGCDQ